MVSRGRPNGSARPCRQRHIAARWRAIVVRHRMDAQRPSGRYDGALGAIAALMAIEAVAARFGQPQRPWKRWFVRRGGSRFPTANFWRSLQKPPGAIASSDADETVGCDDQTMSDAMRAVGLQPERIGEATSTTSRASSNCISSKARCSNMQICPSPSSRALSGLPFTSTPSSRRRGPRRAFRWT